MSRSEKGKSTPVLAVDTGGTFTDLILLRNGEITTLKVPSDPDDPARPVIEGARRILGFGGGERGNDVPESGLAFGLLPYGLLLVLGSTVATNAILERKGVRVVLVTNAGFEDVIEIGRQNRPQLYALVGRRPPPLVAPEDRVGVRGRIGPNGEVIAPLDLAEIAEVAKQIVARGGAHEKSGPKAGEVSHGSRPVEAVAIVLLHSYANSSHEEAVAVGLAAELDGRRNDLDLSDHSNIPISVSSRILPEFREYERTATTVANAYVAPIVSRYLKRIGGAVGAGLDGIRDGPVAAGPQCAVRVMGSSGGALSLARAVAEPVHTVLSGPAGGVVAALEWARQCGADAILSFDMGGTSTDVSLVTDVANGALRRTREGSVGDVPISIPLLDIHTVGAGGGSIARLDPGGALRVGPESAGAFPGPISYGHGGADLTVTDAHLWLGRLPARAFLGGDRPLDREAVRKPLEALARAAGSTPDAIAEGILDVANAAMERALRVVSVERGVDPVGLDLVAFGGAAGLHAAELVERVGLRHAILPPDPGLLSAFGMLIAPVVRERSRSIFLRADAADAATRLSGILGELDAAVRRDMAENERAGMDATGDLAANHVTIAHAIDARYRDQSFELQIPVDDRATGWTESFHRAHEERFGYRRDGVEVEAVTVRVRGEAPGPRIPRSRSGGPTRAPHPPSAPPTLTPVAWRGSTLEARLLPRSSIEPGRVIEGPAVITEYSSTTWCPPGWRIEAHPSGALLLRPQPPGLNPRRGA